MGASTWPPNPQLFVAPRQSQGAPLSRVACCGGPDMAPKPPTVRRAPAEPGRSSVSRRLLRGPRHGPQTPNCSSRPGRARALLCLASPAAGAPTWPPNPQLFVAPRQTQGAPLSRVACCGGPDMAPKPPTVRRAPAEPRRSSVSRRLLRGPDMAPNPPPVRRPPAEPRRSSVSRRLLRGPTWPPTPQLFDAAPAEPRRSSVSRRLLRAPTWAPTPTCSSRPGRAGALLGFAWPAAGRPLIREG